MYYYISTVVVVLLYTHTCKKKLFCSKKNWTFEIIVITALKATIREECFLVIYLHSCRKCHFACAVLNINRKTLFTLM